MPFALISTFKDSSRRKKILTLQATPAGAYTTGGDTLDFGLCTNPKFISLGKPNGNPQKGELTNSPAGYSGELIAGSNMHNWKIKVYTAPGTELPAAAYPAALLADFFVIDVSGPLGAF